MNAKDGYILRLLDGADKKFIIPVYQRVYSWKTVNCGLLFNDLMNVYRNKYKSHFFGSIVYVENDIGGCNEYVIIDGQQRITTVSLLLLAIRNYVLENNLHTEKINPNKITKAFLTDKYALDDKKLKLKLVQGDDDAYNRLILQREPIENNNITINYNYFYSKLCDLSDNEIEGLYDAITKLMVVNISLKPQSGDDPQLIFESLNSTGIDLEESDKIRNYVLMKMEATRQEKIYKNYWEVLEKTVIKQDLNKFIRYYLAKKTRALPDEKKLYFAFKNYREERVIDDSVETLLADMLKYATYYQKIKSAKINDEKSSGHFARINKLEINTVIPLLFDLLEAYDNSGLSDDELNEAVNIIENYIVRRIICGLSTSMLNKTFVYLGEEISRYVAKDKASYIDAIKYAILSKTGKSRFPNDSDFVEKFEMFELYNAKSSIRKYIFERLENFKSKERIAVEEQIENGQLTIEHIMPQKLSVDWQKHLGGNYELIHDKYKDTIGNLTLTAYNSDYSNLMFDRKRDLPDKGFAYSKLELNRFLANCNIWNEEQIVKRAELLSGWALKIWGSPKTDFKPNIVEEWVALDDEYDFTNKCIVKMIFMGDEISVVNITDTYKKIMNTFYMLDPVRFTDSGLSIISSVESNLRNAYELGRSMYIETNLSSRAKITAIREIFKIFEIDFNELTFLVRPKSKQGEIDIDDESTYSYITVGSLAYQLISKLFEDEKLSELEIAELMTKEYTRHFKGISVPILATQRDANKGTGTKFRYYKSPITYLGKEFYISSEWYEESRQDLIKWFKKHYN